MPHIDQKEALRRALSDEPSTWRKETDWRERNKWWLDIWFEVQLAYMSLMEVKEREHPYHISGTLILIIGIVALALYVAALLNGKI